MKVTFFLERFPNYSETFVINQVVSFIDKGIDVNIVSIYPGDTDKKHAVVEQYGLINKTTYLLPKEKLSGAVRIIARLKNVKPKCVGVKFFRSLNVFNYGKHSLNLLLPSIVGHNSKVISADFFISHFGTVGVIADKLREIGFLKGNLATIFHGLDISHTKTLNDSKTDYINLFKRSELILPISELWANKLISLGCPKEKIHISRMGINIDLFKFNESKYSNGSPLHIISVARFVEKKGLEYAIQACDYLKRENIAYKYSIIGDGPLTSILKQRITELGLEEHVRILGFQPQEKIRELLTKADVFLLPSVVATDGDMEGIPVALMEAMAIGLPVISTYHSGIPELIENNISGWLVKERDAEAIAKVLSSLARLQYDITAVTVPARKVIEQKFNQDALNRELCELIERSLS
ncbi:glycosyltransferase [Serratia quinivorans]|uniref:glycosyltransferase n=1 Tax=Serratia quinivorans TaxID=137545 RepID=UPI0021792B55|nr:glycosyltransferase [Serratia quinivorans]CAI0763837.1 GDP-mannose-dependent alpha-(1-6)-phosphatidylinositol monomannoside mannosyltransferase [Serratia quinivorans]